MGCGAYPSPLHYEGFPKSVCLSVNDVMCHGIPDATVLRAGDIVNLDVTVFREGFHGDTSATFIVGGSCVFPTWSASIYSYFFIYVLFIEQTRRRGTLSKRRVRRSRRVYKRARQASSSRRLAASSSAPRPPMRSISDIYYFLIREVADKSGLSVVPEFAGHGVGRIFHSPPFIFHFRNDEPGVMQPGMVFTIGTLYLQTFDINIID